MKSEMLKSISKHSGSNPETLQMKRSGKCPIGSTFNDPLQRQAVFTGPVVAMISDNI